QNYTAHQLRGSTARDGSPSGVSVLEDQIHRSCSVVNGYRFNPGMSAKEILTLSERDRMRQRLADVVERSVRNADQCMFDAAYRLSDDRQIVFEQEVVRPMNRAGHRVLHRNDAVAGSVIVHGLEDILQACAWQKLGMRRKEPVSRIFTECAV